MQFLVQTWLEDSCRTLVADVGCGGQFLIHRCQNVRRVKNRRCVSWIAHALDLNDTMLASKAAHGVLTGYAGTLWENHMAELTALSE